MWQQGMLRLPLSLWTAYRVVLQRYGVLEKCILGTEKKDIHGGASWEDTIEHFTYRFANSSSRICYLFANQERDLKEIYDSIAISFSSHEIFVLDLAGGTGAGVTSLLASLCHLRENNVLPRQPLTVNILAADLSAEALKIYGCILAEIEPICNGAAILINFEARVWDASNTRETNILCNDWLSAVGQNEVFVLVSNLSGVGKVLFGEFQRSFQHITERVSHLPFTLLWVEPPGTGAKGFLKRVAELIFSGAPWISSSTNPQKEFSYQWTHDLQKQKKILSGGVQVMSYERSES